MFVYKCGRKVQSSILPHHSRPGPPSPSRGGARGEGTRTLVWFPSPLAAGSGFFKVGFSKSDGDPVCPGPPSRGGARGEGTRTQTKWSLAGENCLASNNSWGA